MHVPYFVDENFPLSDINLLQSLSSDFLIIIAVSIYEYTLNLIEKGYE